VTIPQWLTDHRLGRSVAHVVENARRMLPANDPRMVPYTSSRDTNDTESHWVVTNDIAFNRHTTNDGHHVSPADNGNVQVGADNITVKLLQGIDVEAFKRTLSAATRATIGLDLDQSLPGDWEECIEFSELAHTWRDRESTIGDWVDFVQRHEFKCVHSEHKILEHPEGYDTYFMGRMEINDWEEMLKGGLQTALETQTIIFAVSGVSRTCTHQLVRSRRAAFHQQSQRASYMGDQPETRVPESVWRNKRARAAFLKAMQASHEAYRVACEEDVSYQDARFALLEGTTNFIMLEYPVREFLNVYGYRACSMFQWEIVAVMRKCREVLVAEYPWLEPYIKISCEKTGPAVLSDQTVEHHCTFQGWEAVEGQCDFPWAREEARTFKPTFHKIGRRGDSS
jgi:flavin-dependent thymidylate synthase